MNNGRVEIVVAMLLSGLAVGQEAPKPPKATQTYEQWSQKLGELADPPTRLRALCQSISIFERKVNADQIWIENLAAENAPPQRIRQARDRLMLNALLLDKFRRDVRDLPGSCPPPRNESEGK